MRLQAFLFLFMFKKYIINRSSGRKIFRRPIGQVRPVRGRESLDIDGEWILFYILNSERDSGGGEGVLYLYCIVSIILIAVGGWGAAGEWPRLGMVLLMLGLGAGGQTLRYWQQHRVPALSLKGLEEEKAYLLTESYEKALLDYRSLEQARRGIRDRELAVQLGRMQSISRNLLSYLERNPEKIPLAQRYIDYYQDRAVTMVQQYRELENTGLTTDRVQEQKRRMKETFATLDEAYMEQFERVLSDQMIASDAEITVMQQHFASEGLQNGAQTEEIPEPEAENAASPAEGVRVLPERGRRKRGMQKAGCGRWSVIPQEERSDVLFHKIAQSVLSIFLGTIGAQKFYQGKYVLGALCIIFFWTGIPTLVGFYEGVKSLFMPMDDFYLEYYRKE